MALLDQAPSPGTRSAALQRITSALPDLAPAERRVAERILADPGHAIALSISEFAELCGVAQPTVSRFCKTLGFRGYAALRLGIAHDFAADGQVGKPGTDGNDGIGLLLDRLSADSALPAVATAIRLASRVEIWPAPDLAAHGALLAARLAELSVPAACSASPSHWPIRAAGMPPDAVVVLLSYTSDDIVWTRGLAAARAARTTGATTICIAAAPAKRLVTDADLLLTLPDAGSAEMTGFLAVEAVTTAVRAVSNMAGPPGPATPWREWPHTEELFLPTDTDPIPAVFLRQPDTTRSDSLVIFYGGLSAPKEESVPPGMAKNRVSPSMVAALLNAGHHVLLPDAPGHGVRKRAWEVTIPLLKESFAGEGDDLLAIGATETRALIDGTMELGAVTSADRIAVVGQSWGGLQVLQKMAADKRIACGVAIMPVCDVAHLTHFTDYADSARVRAANPNASTGKAIAGRPLLLISGGQDQITTPAHITAFADNIQVAYRRNRANFEHLILEDLAHQFDPRQVDAMLTWLGRHLTPKNPG